jgi:Domain of unknown function (DUF4426)
MRPKASEGRSQNCCSRTGDLVYSVRRHRNASMLHRLTRLSAVTRALNMKKNLVAGSVLLLSLCALAACNRPQPTAEIQPAQTSGESFKISGNYEMHYNAVRTDQLSAEIARAYGIERSKNRVMLNISVLHKETGGTATTPSDAEIVVLAHNLNGQVKDVQLRRITETAATYYIGEVPFSGAETLVFEITATPGGSSLPISATLTREFFAD